MCGVFGFALPAAQAVTNEWTARGLSALHTLDHRGPDDSGHLVCGNVFMGHTRLSIIDTSAAGRQPMVSRDALVALTVNGEVYGYRELRTLLARHGFTSTSDSEVLLHGYREWGMDGLLNRVDGMYAGVLLDQERGHLYLFRDRVGIKPLYFGYLHNVFVWASELKAIERFARDSALDLDVDATAALDFAALRYVPAPKSLYRQVAKLAPAHVTTLDLGTARYTTQRYWELPAAAPQQGSARTEADMAEEVRAALAISVRDQLISDVPVGVLLSGGLDSSAIAVSAAGTGAPVSTYTVGFAESAADEAPFAREVAEFLDTRHQEFVLRPPQELDVITRMRGYYDEPFGDTSALPTALVCEAARRDCKVVLSGDGGDELFGGYVRYSRFPRWRRTNSWLGSRRSQLAFRRPPRHLMDKLRNRFALWTQSDPLWLYSALNANLLPAELAPL